MRDLLILAIDLLVTVAKLLRPGGGTEAARGRGAARRDSS